jgi:hypothetical protein
MGATATQVRALLRAYLADRLGQEDLDWLDPQQSLVTQGVGSLDLIAVLARLRRNTGLGLCDGFVLSEKTSLAKVERSLGPVGGCDRSDLEAG